MSDRVELVDIVYSEDPSLAVIDQIHQNVSKNTP